MDFQPLKSVSMWGAAVLALAHVLGSAGVLPAEIIKVIEALAGVATVYGVRRRLPSR